MSDNSERNQGKGGPKQAVGIWGHWSRKFANASYGIFHGMVGQTSFAVHVPVAGVVLAAAWWLQCEVWEWSILLLCIALVLSLEIVNSALECLARGLCHEYNENVGKALDIAGGAVLVVSFFAALIGLIILGGQLAARFGY